MLPWTQIASNACLSVFGRPQGAPADESDGLTAGSGRQREAGAGHAQLLRAVQEDLHRRPGAEIVKGKDAGDAAGIGSRPEVRTSAACQGGGDGGIRWGRSLSSFFFFLFFCAEHCYISADAWSASAVAANVFFFTPPIVGFDVVYNAHGPHFVDTVCSFCPVGQKLQYANNPDKWFHFRR